MRALESDFNVGRRNFIFPALLYLVVVVIVFAVHHSLDVSSYYSEGYDFVRAAISAGISLLLLAAISRLNWGAKWVSFSFLSVMTIIASTLFWLIVSQRAFWLGIGAHGAFTNQFISIGIIVILATILNYLRFGKSKLSLLITYALGLAVWLLFFPWLSLFIGCWLGVECI